MGKIAHIYIYVKMHVCQPSVPRRPRRRTARRWRSCSARSGAQSLRKSRRNGATALRSAPPPGDGETSGQHRGCGGHGHGMGWWKVWWKYGSISELLMISGVIDDYWDYRDWPVKLLALWLDWFAHLCNLTAFDDFQSQRPCHMAYLHVIVILLTENWVIDLPNVCAYGWHGIVLGLLLLN